METSVAVLGDIYQDITAIGLSRLPEWGEDRVVSKIVTQLGGSAANTARHLHGLGMRTYLVGAVGTDKMGRDALEQLHAEGLARWATSPIGIAIAARVMDGSTGTCVVLSGKDDRAFVSCNGVNNTFNPFEDRDAVATVRGSKHVHLHGYFNCTPLQGKQVLEHVATLQRNGTTVSLDTQYDASGKWVGNEGLLLDLIRLVDIFLPNEAEALGILKGCGREVHDVREALEALCNITPKCLVVVKDGGNGALAGRGEERWSRPAEQVKCVDTTGAGDAFDAAFLFSYLSGATPGDALSAGVKGGAVAVQQEGACSAPLKPTDI